MGLDRVLFSASALQLPLALRFSDPLPFVLVSLPLFSFDLFAAGFVVCQVRT